MCPTLMTSALKVLAVAEWPSQWLDWGSNGPAPLQTAGVPWWMFPRGIGNKTKFFSLFFFSDKPFHGQFSQDDPIIILQRRLPPPNPMGGLSEGKRKRKKEGKGGGGDLVIHQWRLDDNKIHDKIKWDESTLSSLMDCVECMCAFCLLQYFKENWSNQGQKWT